MLKVFLFLTKWMGFAIVVLVLGYKIEWDGMSLAEHVESTVCMIEKKGFPGLEKQIRGWMNGMKKNPIIKKRESR